MAGLMYAIGTLLFVSTLGVAPGTVHYYRHDGRLVSPLLQYTDGRWTLSSVGHPESPKIVLSDRLLVWFEPGVVVESQVLNPLSLKKIIIIHSDADIWLLQAKGPLDALEACAQLVERGLARWAVPDYLIQADLSHIPDDPLYPDQWHLGGHDGQHIHAEGAWDITIGDPRVVIAILDTGVDMSHPDLDRDRMVPGYDAVHDDDDPSPSSKAIDHHGTACAGLAAATMDNAIGVCGVCPGCSWMAIRIFDDGGYMALSALSRGMVWAVDHGAWILSNSWVVSQSLIDSGVDIEPVREAIRYAVGKGRDGKGCLVLFAAGNGDSELNAEPVGKDELQSMDEVMTVGGCDQNGVVAKYSNYGPSVSVVAPTWSGYPEDPYITTTDTSGDEGTNRGGIHYHTDPGGQDIATSRPEPDVQGDYTAYFSGTSASCPIAAGLAGLVLSASTGLGWQQVRKIVEDTADKVGRDAQLPRLAADYDQDGIDPHYGHGRINALAAVARAKYGESQADGASCWLDGNCTNSCLHRAGESQEGVCVTLCTNDGLCGQGRECLDGVCVERIAREIEGGCGCRHQEGRFGLFFVMLLYSVLYLFRKRMLRF